MKRSSDLCSMQETSEVLSRLVLAIRLKAGLSGGSKREQVSKGRKGRDTSFFLQGFYSVSDSKCYIQW